MKASPHDGKTAIPLATMTGRRVVALCGVKYVTQDSSRVRAAARELGRVPVIDPNPRRHGKFKERLSRERRATGAPCALSKHGSAHSAAERANAR